MMRRRTFLTTVLLAAAAKARATEVSVRVRAHVAIVGGGFAGSSCALALRHADPNINVTLIDPDDRYVTCPMSNEAIVGERSLASLTVDRNGLARAGVRVRRERVRTIDAEPRSVSLASGESLRYDRLVVAPGIRFLWGTPEGYDEDASNSLPHAWRAGAQTELLAQQLRAMEDGGVVAISVPGGLMRCPPAPYERASLIADYLKRHKPRSKVLIFDANNHFPRQPDFTEAWKASYADMIEWISPLDGGIVERVDAKTRTLYTSNGAQRVAVANIIPPQAPGQLAADVGLSTGHGWCPVVADTFESKNIPGVYVIGDACIAGAMPKAASAAHSQALRCAAAIVEQLGGNKMPEAAFDSVCYSLLAPNRALSIHGSFHVADGEIVPSMRAMLARTAEDEAKRANAWYSQIVTESFGA